MNILQRFLAPIARRVLAEEIRKEREAVVEMVLPFDNSTNTDYLAGYVRDEYNERVKFYREWFVEAGPSMLPHRLLQ